MGELLLWMWYSKDYAGEYYRAAVLFNLWSHRLITRAPSQSLRQLRGLATSQRAVTNYPYLLLLALLSDKVPLNRIRVNAMRSVA